MKWRLANNLLSVLHRAVQWVVDWCAWSRAWLFAVLRQRTGVWVYAPVNGVWLPPEKLKADLLADAMLGPTWVFETNSDQILAPFRGRIIYCSKQMMALEHPLGMKCILTIVPRPDDVTKFIRCCRVGAVVRNHQHCFRSAVNSINSTNDKVVWLRIALILVPQTIEGQKLQRFVLADRLTSNTILAKISPH